MTIKHYPSDTFGGWLQARGVPSLQAVPAQFRTLAIRIHRGEVAPNSPMLPRYAESLGVSLDALQAFATAPPLGPKWVMKIQTQLDRGTLPHGHRTKPHKQLKQRKQHKQPHETTARAPKHPKGDAGPVAQLIYKHTGLTAAALARQLGLTRATMTRVCAGQLGRNHPLLPPLAKAIGVELRELLTYMHGQRLSSAMLKTVQSRLARGAKKARHAAERSTAQAPGTALVHVPKKAALVKAGSKKYNKLRSKPLTLREVARGLVASINIAIMAGKTEMPDLPIRELHLVLTDYLLARGVSVNALVDPEFPTLFDPRS